MALVSAMLTRTTRVPVGVMPFGFQRENEGRVGNRAGNPKCQTRSPSRPGWFIWGKYGTLFVVVVVSRVSGRCTFLCGTARLKRHCTVGLFSFPLLRRYEDPIILLRCLWCSKHHFHTPSQIGAPKPEREFSSCVRYTRMVPFC